MIEIKIDPDDEKWAYVERAGSIRDVELPVEIWIEGEAETPQAEPAISFSMLIWPFFSVLLDRLEDLENGEEVQFALQLQNLVVKPSDDTVRLALDDEFPSVGHEQFGPRYEVPLKAFAAELIATADDFIVDITERRPIFANSEYTHKLADTIEQARDWYRQKYGSVPDSE